MKTLRSPVGAHNEVGLVGNILGQPRIKPGILASGEFNEVHQEKITKIGTALFKPEDDDGQAGLMIVIGDKSPFNKDRARPLPEWAGAKAGPLRFFLPPI